MVTVIITTQGQPTEVVVDGKKVDFGPSAPGTGANTPVAPEPNAVAPSISSKPATVADLGTGHGPRVERDMRAGEVVGLSFTVRATGDANKPVLAREISWNGMPGGTWNRTSWAVFNSAGTKVLGQDNVAQAQGFGLDTNTLKGLAPGEYVLAIGVNGPGNGVTAKTGIVYNQKP